MPMYEVVIDIAKTFTFTLEADSEEQAKELGTALAQTQIGRERTFDNLIDSVTAAETL